MKGIIVAVVGSVIAGWIIKAASSKPEQKRSPKAKSAKAGK